MERMKAMMTKRTKRGWVSLFGAVAFGIWVLVLVFMGGENVESEQDDTTLKSVEVRAKVLAVDNEEVIATGVASIGYQSIEALVLSGAYKDTQVLAVNLMNGQADLDNLYKEGDHILLALQLKEGTIVDARALDFMRLPWLMLLFGGFVVFLLIYAGVIGLKALISFLLSVVILWDVFIRGLLDGKDPIGLVMITVVLLTAIIVFLVAGLTRKALCAFLGTISGLLITMGLTITLGQKIGLYGMTQPYVQQVIFSGYYDLDIRKIFYAAIVLGASGAAMDIAMDIAASMAEIKEKKADISAKELIESGFSIGRHVIGTMATTLLLAYSGGYVTLLMVFQIKDASFLRMLNLKIVSAEIMRTLIGSMGLVMVAPITAVLSGIILTKTLSLGEEEGKASLEN